MKDDQTGQGSGDRTLIMRAQRRWVATGAATVQVKGEIDLSSVGELAGVADNLDGAAVIILDMSGVSFLDAAGVTALLRLAARLSLTGRHLILTRTDHHPVRRPITICRIDTILDCRSTAAASSEKSPA